MHAARHAPQRVFAREIAATGGGGNPTRPGLLNARLQLAAYLVLENLDALILASAGSFWRLKGHNYAFISGVFDCLHATSYLFVSLILRRSLRIRLKRGKQLLSFGMTYF